MTRKSESKFNSMMYGKPPLEEIRNRAVELAHERRMGPKDLFGHSNFKHLVRTRWEIWFQIRKELMPSTIRIGQAMNRDHSTVIYGLKRYMQETGEQI
jgi:chromosomal replication initiation ATPase DnaA